MNEKIRAEYDAATRTLRLVEPLVGIADHQEVFLEIEAATSARDWRELRGSLPEGAAEDLRRILIAERDEE